MKKYPVYLFDFDYTLVDSSQGIIRCFQITLKKFHRPQADPETIRHTIGIPMKTAVARIIGEHDPKKIESFLKQYRLEANRYMTPLTFFFPEVLSVLRTLRRKGARIAIVSSKNRARIEEKLRADRVLDLFDWIIGPEEVRQQKPSPEGLLLACQHFHIDKSAALYIGDSFVDAEAAAAAGIDFCAVTTGTTPAEIFQNYPHKAIFSSLQALLKA